MKETRTRKLPFKPRNHTGTLTQSYYYIDGRPGGSTTTTTNEWNPSIEGTQVTVSENHPEWRKRNNFRGSDIGGDFSTTKSYVTCNPGIQTISYRGSSFNPEVGYLESYQGPIVVSSLGGISFPPAIGSTNNALDMLGTKAVALAKPTNSIVDLSVTLGELLAPGGIPRLFGHSTWQSRAEALRLKGASKDYLNVEFGWKPLLSDIESFALAVSSAGTVLKQYERDAGKTVRRRWSFEPVTEATSSLHAGGVPYTAGISTPTMYEGSPVPQGQVIRLREKTVSAWFSGAFTYHLPTGYSSAGTMNRLAAEADRLLSLQITPDTIWNLTPWSWAIDWFSSLGDVVSNLSDWASDGLVMQYGYMMEKSTIKDTYTWDGPNPLRGRPTPSPATFVTETKLRRKANPFGFGVTWEGLTPRQVAIAAALGITKS